MPVDFIVVIALFMALAFYMLTGGADYGAGMWNIFVSKSLADRQRDLIDKAIQPIWEANHVWLILVVVILFMAYPAVYAFLCTTLNIPISLALIGVVMRGVAFVSRKYDMNNDFMQKAWGNIFAAASVVTPFLFGAMIGAISAGHLAVPTAENVDIWATLFAPWLTPYAMCLGGFTLSIFAMLAASYLTVDAHGDDELQVAFRNRALISHVIVAFFAVASIMFAGREDVWVYKRISELPWAIAAGGAFVLFFATTVSCLATKHYFIARITAAGEAFIILLGYAAAQYPYLVPPDYTLINSAASKPVLQMLVLALVVGAVLLFPSLFYLFKLFKGEGKHGTQAPM